MPRKLEAMNTKFNGSTVKLGGNFAEVGAKAPDFKMVKSDLSNFTLGSAAGRRLLLNIFPSLDTSICAMSVRRFNKMASEINDALVLCISKDLPFAQKRFCTTENLANVIPLSDCRIGSTFGTDYGVAITDGVLEGLFARAVVIVSPEGKIEYAALSPEITQEPDYDSAMAALAKA